jgi:hypothetical protein
MVLILFFLVASLFTGSLNQNFITAVWRSGEIKEKPGDRFWKKTIKAGINTTGAGD